jgi:hypothetical protein
MLIRSSSIRLALVLLAIILALFPLPAALVEGWYSQGFYLRLQGLVTPVTNLVPLALFDIAIAVAVVAIAWLGVRSMRRHGFGRSALFGLRGAVVGAAAVYLVFLLMWGFNYQRVPLEAALDYDEARITRDSARAFAAEAAHRANAAFVPARDASFDEGMLAEAFSRTQRALGAPRTAEAGTPKASLLGFYFRQAAIDGMTNPFFLEIILNPDLLAMERPMVLAHEWAHLAGYAHETEANFVAWLTCLQGDAVARYSAWLSAYEHAVSALSREDRRALPPLDEGPRDDLRAMTARYHRSSPVVRLAARDVYDSYLRANRVAEGIASYGAVVRLMLGSQLEEDRTPRLRSR